MSESASHPTTAPAKRPYRAESGWGMLAVLLAWVLGFQLALQLAIFRANHRDWPLMVGMVGFGMLLLYLANPRGRLWLMPLGVLAALLVLPGTGVLAFYSAHSGLARLELEPLPAEFQYIPPKADQVDAYHELLEQFPMREMDFHPAVMALNRASAEMKDDDPFPPAYDTPEMAATMAEHGPKLDAYLEFLATRQPLNPDIPAHWLRYDHDTRSLPALRAARREVQYLVHQGRIAEAQAKYLRLWKIIELWLAAPAHDLDVKGACYIMDSLCEYNYDKWTRHFLPGVSTPVRGAADRCFKAIPEAMRSGNRRTLEMGRRYLASNGYEMDVDLEFKKYRRTPWQSIWGHVVWGGGFARIGRWPLQDPRLTERLFVDRMEWRTLVLESTAEDGLEEMLEWRAMKDQVWRGANPAGEYLARREYVREDEVMHEWRSRSVLTAFIYTLDWRAGTAAVEPPEDPMRGEAYAHVILPESGPGNDPWQRLYLAGGKALGTYKTSKSDKKRLEAAGLEGDYLHVIEMTRPTPAATTPAEPASASAP